MSLSTEQLIDIKALTESQGYGDSALKSSSTATHHYLPSYSAQQSDVSYTRTACNCGKAGRTLSQIQYYGASALIIPAFHC